MNISRRSFLGAGGLSALAGALPSWMPRLAFRAPGVPARGDTLVCIFQRGGMDGLSAVIPYQERDYYTMRPQIAFAAPKAGDAKSTLKLDDRFALNPALTNLKRAWDNGHLAVVHAVGSPNDSRSHFDAMDLMERGSDGEGSLDTGWLGRHLATTASANDSPFRAVGMGSLLQQSLRGPIPVAALQSIADFHLQGRTAELMRFREQLAELYAGGDWWSTDAQATFAALDLLEAKNPLQYQPANGADYPDTSFGQALAQVAQLIKADVGLEVACIDLGGWDLHTNMVWINYGDPTRGQMYNLLSQLDQGLGAFYTDLGRQYFEDPGVTVVSMSEFGRRAAQNAAAGTDHGRGNCMFVMSGGAVQGVHADWPGLAPGSLDSGDLKVTTDYRDVLAEILAKRLGNAQLPAVFPDHEVRFRGVVQQGAYVRPAPGAPAGRVYLPDVRG